MNVVVSGDVHRRHQQANIDRLAEVLRPHLEDAGVAVSVATETPLPWLAWLDRFERGPFPATEDLVVGFELPPAATRSLPAWVDVRVHPYRFTGAPLWSVRSNVPGVAEIVASRRVDVEVPRFSSSSVDPVACFTAQVPFDASLVRGGRVIQPADVLPGILAFAARFPEVMVVPHPSDPFDVWGRFVVKGVPNAKPSTRGAYETMARCRHLLTVSSSTGIEAPLFDCEPEFLAEPPECSDPIDIDDAGLWAAIIEAAAA